MIPTRPEFERASDDGDADDHRGSQLRQTSQDSEHELPKSNGGSRNRVLGPDLRLLRCSLSGITKHLLPAFLRRIVRETWENVRDWLDTCLFAVRFVASQTPRPRLILYFGFAPGDDLLCTAVLRELHNRDRDRLLMISNHSQLFAGNTDASVRPLWRRYYADSSTVQICRRFTELLGGEFKRPHYAPLMDADQSRPPSRHIIAELCAETGITGQVTLRPYLTVTDAEKAAASWAGGQIVIQSSGMGGRQPILNKQWPAERFQGVVDELTGEFEFIQLGATIDPLLRHTKDLRGATNIRDSAAILHQARLFVGTVGFLMHLARAVDCPSAIIFGGREAPWQSGYICNFNLYSPVPCAPCWRWNSCDIDRQCLKDISVTDVVSAIRHMMARPRGPLPVEVVDIAPSSPMERPHA